LKLSEPFRSELPPEVSGRVVAPAPTVDPKRCARELMKGWEIFARGRDGSGDRRRMRNEAGEASM